MKPKEVMEALSITRRQLDYLGIKKLLLPAMKQGPFLNALGRIGGRRMYRQEDVGALRRQWEEAAQKEK